MKKNDATFWFSFLQFCYWTLSFITDGVYASFLKSLGYGEAFIGVTLTVTGLAGILLLPVSGLLADRTSRFRRMAALAFLLMGGSVPFVMLFSGSRAAVFLYAFLGGGFTKVVCGLLNSWVNKLSKEREGLDFGRIRSIGSISYAVSAPVLGALFSRLGYGVSGVLAALLAAGGIFGALQLPDPARGEGEQGPGVREAASHLLRERSFLLFLFCNALMSVTTQSFFAFFSLLVEDAGGTVGTLGLDYFLIAFLEFWVMRYSSRIAARFGTARTLGAGMVGNFFKSFLHSLAATVPQLFCCSATQCFSFALVVPCTAVYLRETVDKRYLATAILVSQMCSTSIVPFLFSSLYGSAAEALGVRQMIRLFSFPALAAGLLFLLLAPKLAKKAEDGAPV